jgi:DnaJ-class molecular chaperone
VSVPDEDEVAYDECPACGGDGGHEVDSGGTYPWGEFVAVWQECEECGGSGVAVDEESE